MGPDSNAQAVAGTASNASDETDEKLMLEQLDQVLNGRPRALEDVLELVRRDIGDGVNARTWAAFSRSTSDYLGPPATLVQWVVSEDHAERMKTVEELGSFAVAAFLRSILGYFGADLENAYALRDSPPDDWRRVDREVLYDAIRDRWNIKVTIHKFGGDQVVIESTPDSYADLLSYLMETLRKVGSPATIAERFKAALVTEANVLSDFLKKDKETLTATSSDPGSARSTPR